MDSLIIRIGKALFGLDHWQAGLCKATGVNPRTVRRWAAGEVEPSAGVFRDMLPIMEERRAELASLVDAVKARSDPHSGGVVTLK